MKEEKSLMAQHCMVTSHSNPKYVGSRVYWFCLRCGWQMDVIRLLNLPCKEKE